MTRRTTTSLASPPTFCTTTRTPRRSAAASSHLPCECANEVADYALHGGVLYAAQGTELVTYAVRPGSVFAG